MIAVQSKIENGLSRVNEILSKIAADNKPFIDISTSHSWGLIPFIAKFNPQIPCMATDIYTHLVKCRRIFLNLNLTQYNINLACFNNNNIPIKSNVLDYVTSTLGISSSASENSKNFMDLIVTGREKPISEIYRILKPGGCFVTIEINQEWKFDLTKTRDTFNRRGKLFDKYSYDEIENLHNKLQSYSWSDQFTAAGFEVEIAEKYPKKIYGDELRSTLYNLTNHFKIPRACLKNVILPKNTGYDIICQRVKRGRHICVVTN